MRIAHVSDLHIRNFKYRDEYRSALDDLYRRLDGLRPDLIVNTGDTVHSKLAVSPELFDDVARHMLEVCRIAPYWLILGNHDLNLKNSDRMDAISPVVRALQGRTHHELRMPEPQKCGERMLRGKFPEFVFWNHDIRGHGAFDLDPADVNVGLYHGSISGCVTDIGFKMEKGESEVSRFADMDYVLMGDIHKRQSFRGGRMQYAGSLIQQNYGEEVEKGFLLWDIHDKDRFEVKFYPVRAPGRFFTVQVPASLDLEGIDVPKGSRVKVRVDGEITPSRRVDLERALTEKFAPLEIITPDTSAERKALEEIDLDTLVLPREDMMREHLAEKGCKPSEIDEAIRLWDELAKDVDQDASRGTTWSLGRIAWDNMMNYGEGNSIDLTKVRGLVGIFAPNASGKSSIFDIILQTFFDKLSKEVPRNIDLINDNKDEARMEATFESGGQEYRISRLIERISYGQRKLAETKQWGKTSLDLTRGEESLNGDSRPETERVIRRIVGSFEDFALTTMVSQNPIFGLPGGGDIINCKETDRRKILFRFLDLDVYERVHQLVKDDLKTIVGNLRGQDAASLDVEISALRTKTSSLGGQVVGLRELLDGTDRTLGDLRSQLDRSGVSDIEKLEREESRLGAEVVRRRAAWSRAGDRNSAASKRWDSLREKHENLTQNPPKVPEIGLAELTARLDEHKSAREGIKVKIARHADDLKRGSKALHTLEGIPCEGKFPSCRYITEAVEFKSRRDEVQAAITELVKAGTSHDFDIVGLERFRVQHDERILWERELSGLELDIERQRNEVRESDAAVRSAFLDLFEAQTALSEVRSRIDAAASEAISVLKSRISEAEAHRASLSRQIDDTLKVIGATDAKRATAEAELSNLTLISKKVAALEALEEMTGKAGLPYRILTRVLPVINAEIDKILGGITKFSVFFEDDSETQSVSLFIRYGDYRSRPLSLGSGAEKFIASIAVRAALLNVSSLPKTDVLIIDEGFGKLDPEHLESLQKMFEYLREAFGTVFVVSHVDSMRDIVDHSVEITSQDGYAHVEVC